MYGRGMANERISFLLLAILLSACDPTKGKEVRECVAEDCTCSRNSDCVIEECAYYTPTLRRECWEMECDCRNGWPVPQSEVALIIDARDEWCTGESDTGTWTPREHGRYDPCQSANCGDTYREYRPVCYEGRCIGVADR